MKALFLSLFIGTATLAPSLAQANIDESERPKFSAPLEAEHALDAFTQAKEIGGAAEADLQSRYLADPDREEPHKRTDPILYDVSWPYQACSDINTILPPPMDGWGIRALTAQKSIPITETNATVHYYAYADAQNPEDFPKTSVTFKMSSNPADVEGMGIFLSRPEMRSVMFKDGPFGYPVMKMQTGALVGDVLVYISATDEVDAEKYLEKIIGCATKSQFLPEGIDAEQLRSEP